jgi:hypothetical protein
MAMQEAELGERRVAATTITTLAEVRAAGPKVAGGSDCRSNVIAL